MRTSLLKFILLGFFIFCITLPQAAFAWVKGIYINQESLENTNYLTYLIKQAKSVGIDTFVIDLNKMTAKYQQNIRLVTDNNIRYVARIIIFRNGGTDAQVLSEPYWETKFLLAKQAVGMGAKAIQLDYVRYNTKLGASPEHARNIGRVISWFSQRVHNLGADLQIDVFGITSFGEEPHIGQSVRLFAHSVDAMCPMDYPSHFEPFREHAVTPYETILTALTSFRAQLDNQLPFKVYTYIELSNYRFPLSREQRYKYIIAQIKAVEDGHADGWYAWSPNNLYDNLFTVLRSLQSKT